MPALDTRIAIQPGGSGPPLVLLHCLGVDHRFWDFASPLGTDFTIYRYDLPGHGTTPTPKSAYDIEDLSNQLAAIMRAQGVARASIAGISLGGLIAQDFAARHQEMTDKLILVDTTPRYTDEMRSMWAERAETARTKGVSAMVDPLLKIWFSAGATTRNPAAVDYVRNALSSADGEGYALACEALARADLQDCAPRIKARTLVICGDDDIPSFLDAARWLSANIAGAELSWIPQTRHASVIECPETAVRIIKTFLQKS